MEVNFVQLAAIPSHYRAVALIRLIQALLARQQLDGHGAVVPFGRPKFDRLGFGYARYAVLLWP